MPAEVDILRNKTFQAAQGVLGGDLSDTPKHTPKNYEFTPATPDYLGRRTAKSP